MGWGFRGRSGWGDISSFVAFNGSFGREISLTFGRMSGLGGVNFETNFQEFMFYP